MQKKESIYDMMNGYLNCDALMLPKEEMLVKDEFEDGMYCRKKYEEVYRARCNLENKLGCDEDEDVEVIINGMNDIMRYLAMKMYDYGRSSAVGDDSRGG